MLEFDNYDYDYIKDNPELYSYVGKYISKDLLDFQDINQLYILLEPILKSDFWNRIKSYPHHDNDRGYHIMGVVFRSYYKAIKKKLTTDKITKTVYIALFHDCFDYDWKLPTEDKLKFKELHAFAHPKRAFEQAKKHFPELIDKEIENGIKSHMFPITITKFPKYRTGWIVSFADKYASKHDAKNIREYPLYLGLTPEFLKIYQKVYDFIINTKIIMQNLPTYITLKRKK